jgi:hypothetical protein
MDNSSNKSIFADYIILITILLFVVIYIINNFDNIKQGNIYNGDFTKSLLLTAIIILVIYMFITWDDNNIDGDQNIENINENIDIPKFKLSNNVVNEPLKRLSLSKIMTNSQPVLVNSINNINPIKNSIDKYDNPNIFISQKNIGKYGIKF